MSKKVNKIDDFIEDLIWMSMRFWVTNSELGKKILTNYPDEFNRNFYGIISKQLLQKQLEDMKREQVYGFFGHVESRDDVELMVRTLETMLSDNYKGNISGGWEECNDFEFALIRLAIQYACPRQTIASSSLPLEIISNRYNSLSKEQKDIIVSDLQSRLDEWVENNMKPVFGDELIDHDGWIKFMTALDEDKHYTVQLINGMDIVAFKCIQTISEWDETERKNIFHKEEVIFPLDKYIERPYHNIYIPKENVLWKIV